LLVARELTAKTSQLHELLEPTVRALGYRLWGLEYRAQGRQALLRVYIDSAEGITVDDCARVSHQLSGVLDVEDPIAGEYSLEVSSPGMDRPLFTLEQFNAYVGDDVRLRLRAAFEGRRKFQGRLVGVEDDEVILVVDEHEYILPYELIDKANIVPRFD
jgi:ribosome maturation factor RimP